MVSSTLVLIVVSRCSSPSGLNPLVEFFDAPRAEAAVGRAASSSCSSLAALALFVIAIVPVISDQVAAIVDNAPGWFDQLQHNRQVQRLDDQYDVIAEGQGLRHQGRLRRSRRSAACWASASRSCRPLVNAFVIIVLTLYFLVVAAETTKQALYRLAPATPPRPGRRASATRSSRNVGGYVSGAFMVAMCAGLSSLIFLFVVGLGEYAVALAFVVALLDVIPMIGATLGAVVVTAIGFATDPKIGLVCLIFYVVYQQVENYVIYPRVMSRSVDIPGAVTVIAALVGAGAARRRRRPAGHPHRGGDPDADPRGLRHAAGRALA